MAGVEGEKELEDFLTDVIEGRAEKPPSEPEPVEPVEPPSFPDEEEPEPEPEEVPDEEEQPVPVAEAEEAEETEPVAEPGSVSWAKKKYGDDPERWAHAAYQQEQFISKLSAEKRQAEEFAQQMAEYAQYTEQQAVTTQQGQLPLSAQEEAWIDQAVANPVNAAYAALMQNNIPLYNGLIERIAEDNPALAANVGAQAQMAAQQQYAAQQVQADATGVRESDFPTKLNESAQRTGVNLQVHGEQMSAKIGELGEYHPYVQTIMYAQDPAQRDLALMAVYDLVRAGQATTQRARETEHESRIRREGELRREAASVVTGSPHTPPQKESPFMEAMMNEWKRAGQWTDDNE